MNWSGDGIPVLTLLGIVLGMEYLWSYVFKIVGTVEQSGDAVALRRAAYSENWWQPVTPPYCYRPLVPLMARYFGYRLVTTLGLLVLALGLYALGGRGWTGVAVALAFMLMPAGVAFHATFPEYIDAVGYAVVTWGIVGLWGGHGWAVIPMFLAPMVRETCWMVLVPVAIVSGQWWTLLGWALGWVGWWWLKKPPDWSDKHPLVKGSPRETLDYWLRIKQGGLIHYAHTWQVFRATPFAIPFTWPLASTVERWSLLGLLGAWVSGWPGSGQSRMVAYGFPLLVPYLKHLDPAYLWLIVALALWWPFPTLNVYDESGKRAIEMEREQEAKTKVPILRSGDAQGTPGGDEGKGPGGGSEREAGGTG